MIFSQNLFRRPTPARLTRIEKSLLQAHFRSVNYCQYNFVAHRTLIYVPACIMTYICEIKKPEHIENSPIYSNLKVTYITIN